MIQTQDKAVKGTMVLDLVKTIKGFKDKPWDQYLSKEARELLGQRILPSFCYPYEPVINCLQAVYQIMGEGKPENARMWGKINGLNLFETTYKNLLTPGDTEASLQKLEVISGVFFKGFHHESRTLGKNHTQVIIPDNDPRTESLYYIILGWIDAIIERSGGKNAKVLIIQKHWEGHPATIMDIRWE